ncbi:MAG: YqaJ-like viral recombinase domain protein [Candidatus Izimaplasma bacterium HR2]|nr:MAG: YqaJ-like viral recombinase domain protein [Candidatus Izimaplasma bacterium HR2]
MIRKSYDDNFSKEVRMKSIGGSDAAVVLGLSKYKSAIDLWLEKTGQKEPDDLSDNEAVEWGNILEPVIANQFSKKTGKELIIDTDVLYHSDYDFISANIDRDIVGEDAGLECKNTSEYMLSQWEDEEVPVLALVQCQHYMFVTGSPRWYVAGLIGGNKLRWKPIERDNELIEMMLEKYKSFWKCVETNTMPEVDEFGVNEGTLKYLYPDSNGLTIDSSSIDSEVEKLMKLKQDKKVIDSQIKEKELSIKDFLEDNEVGRSLNFQVTWKTQTANRIDSKRFKSDHPELSKQYYNESKSRVLRVKKL